MFISLLAILLVPASTTTSPPNIEADASGHLVFTVGQGAEVGYKVGESGQFKSITKREATIDDLSSAVAYLAAQQQTPPCVGDEVEVRDGKCRAKKSTDEIQQSLAYLEQLGRQFKADAEKAVARCNATADAVARDMDTLKGSSVDEGAVSKLIHEALANSFDAHAECAKYNVDYNHTQWLLNETGDSVRGCVANGDWMLSLTGGTCLDIYNQGATRNGVYTITSTAQQETVYCDMEEGGWTLVSWIHPRSRKHIVTGSYGGIWPTDRDLEYSEAPWKLSDSDIHQIKNSNSGKQGTTTNAFKFYCGQSNQASGVQSKSLYNNKDDAAKPGGGVTQYFDKNCAFGADRSYGCSDACFYYRDSPTATTNNGDYCDSNDCGLGGHAHGTSNTFASYGWHSCSGASGTVAGEAVFNAQTETMLGCGHNDDGTEYKGAGALWIR